MKDTEREEDSQFYEKLLGRTYLRRGAA